MRGAPPTNLSQIRSAPTRIGCHTPWLHYRYKQKSPKGVKLMIVHSDADIDMLDVASVQTHCEVCDRKSDLVLGLCSPCLRIENAALSI